MNHSRQNPKHRQTMNCPKTGSLSPGWSKIDSSWRMSAQGLGQCGYINGESSLHRGQAICLSCLPFSVALEVMFIGTERMQAQFC